MKKESIRLLSLFLFASIFFISLISFVSAQNPLIDPIVGAFNSGLTIGGTKILFFILLSMLIWSILETSGFVRQNGARWIISLVVAFLGIAYLTPEDIWGLLLSYNALGLTLLFLVPFAILFFFSLRVIKVGNASGVVTQYLMWIIFFIFLLYRWYVASFSPDAKIVFGDPTSMAFILAIIVSGFMVFGNKWIRKWLGDTFLSAEIEAVQKTQRRVTEIEKARSKSVQEESDSA